MLVFFNAKTEEKKSAQLWKQLITSILLTSDNFIYSVTSSYQAQREEYEPQRPHALFSLAS